MVNATNDRMHVLIIGAGVAGLTLAALLRQRGQAPLVIEREPSLANRGYMLGLYPLGSRVLQGLGLYDQYLAQSVTLRRYCIHNGRGACVRDYNLQAVNQRFGPIQGISRGGLIDLLQQGVGDLPLRPGATVKELNQRDDKVCVSFSDGSARDFDLVVGADGMHSETRRMVLAESEYAYRDTGWGGWAFWVDSSLAPQDTFAAYWGAGRFLGLYPVRDQLGVFVGGPVSQIQSLGLMEFSRYVQQRFKSPVPALDCVPADSFFWKFHDCRCKHWHRGRVILLGDAAVGFLPTAGVGASMAMESAAALNDELSRTNAERVEQALTLFERRHRGRVERAQAGSRKLGRMMFVRSRVLSAARDQLLRFYSVERLVRGIAEIMEEPI